jgi:site-specific DNA-adenine methylase
MLGGPDTKGSLMHQLGNSLNEFKQSFDHTLKEHATKQEAVTHKIYELLLILSAKYCTNSSCDKALRGLFNKIFDEYCTNANCDARIKIISDGLKKELEAA